MLHDVVAVGLLEDAPVLEVPVKGLVTSHCRNLHAKVVGRVAVIVRTLDLVWVLHVAIVGLNVLVWLKTVQENTVKNLDVRPRAGRVRSLNLQ